MQLSPTGRSGGAPASIPALAQWAATAYGERAMVVDGPTRLSFRAVGSLALQATQAAMATGIRPGDRVAIWAPNSWEWIVAALGALGAGAWLVPVNTRFKGEEAAYVLDRVDATALFTVTGFLDTDYPELLRAVSPGLRCLERLVMLAGSDDDGARAFDEFLDEGRRVGESAARSQIAAVRSDDVADVIFTSGTTGHPKGVMLEHGASIRGYDEWARRFGLREGDRYLIVNPFFHCFGYKAGWMACLQQGATAYPLATLDVERVLTLVETERISALPGPPTLFLALLDAASGRDLRSLRTGFVGASTVAPELLRRIREDLPFERLTTGYGLTESTALVSITAADGDAERIAYWNGGYPLDGVEVAIVDDEGGALPDETPGEIMVRGFNVMCGYYNDPAATAQAITDDGWLHTGDIGMRRATGELRISDRKKDIYISGGFNVSPAEVENLLLGFEAIAQVAVIGVPDARLGEVGAAFVVARPDASLCADDVREWARAHMANFKVPRVVELVDELPLNSTGKVMKHVLRARVAGP